MSQPTHTKIDCEVNFSHDTNPNATSKNYLGIFHLFEHAYDKRLMPCWYGVVEVACDRNAMQKTLVQPLENVRLNIKLDDGRKGVARYTSAHLDSSAGIDIFRMAVFGMGAWK